MLDKKKVELIKLKSTLEQSDYRKSDLQLIVLKYELFDIIYEDLFHQMKNQSQ